MLRDFGLTLGPAVIGAFALTKAANAINAQVAASPQLQTALAAFNQAPAHAPAAEKAQVEAAVGAVNSGPLGANAVPSTVTLPDGSTQPFNPLKDIAFHALSDAYAIGYLICGIAALIAALIAAVFIGGRKHHDTFLETE
jgi:subtilisin family serine protease